VPLPQPAVVAEQPIRLNSGKQRGRPPGPSKAKVAWTVEKLLEYRVTPSGVEEWLVKWTDAADGTSYPHSWEPLVNFKDSTELVEQAASLKRDTTVRQLPVALPPEKRLRGRPRKNAAVVVSAINDQPLEDSTEQLTTTRRGCPRAQNVPAGRVASAQLAKGAEAKLLEALGLSNITKLEQSLRYNTFVSLGKPKLVELALKLKKNNPALLNWSKRHFILHRVVLSTEAGRSESTRALSVLGPRGV